VQAYPFHMTAVNMARHRNSPNMPFWTMLKEGSDHFEVTHLEPKVDVCEKRYVFDAQPNATPVPGAPDAPAATAAFLHFNPTGRCPAYQLAPDIAAAVEQKRHRDEVETADLVSRGTPTVPTRTGMDGGTNAAFLGIYQPEQVRDAQGQIHTVVARRAPGLIFVNSNPAPDPSGTAAETPKASVVPAVVTQTAAAAAPPSGGAFGLAASDSKPAPQARSGNLFTRWFRLGGDNAKPDAATHQAATQPPPPIPHNRPHPAAVAAAKPAPKGKAEPAEGAPPREARAAPSAPPKVTAENSLLTGAQPTVPVGSFDSRWSAIQ